MNKPFYIPHGFQSEAIQSIFDYFQSGKKGNPLVVAPTGSGKSIMIAEFCRIVRSTWSDQKILVISHDMEILSQDHKSISKQLPKEKIGLYSAGLKSRTIEPVTVGGIQSIFNKPDLFKNFNIIVLDEAHTVSYDKKSRYRKFFKEVVKPVIGFTATPFRLGTGYLHLGEGSFFDDIVYEIKIKDLQDAGFLCKLSTKQAGITLDASAIKKQAGDFIIKELSLAFDREGITTEIIQDLVKYKDLRKKWLVYCIDIDHCNHVTDKLNEFGIRSKAIHSKSGISRGPILDSFKKGRYQAIVSVAMLTTGVDVPEADLAVLLRPTASPVLHIQIPGRIMRTAPGKEDGLILDYAGNFKRNGPIDAPVLKISGKGNGDPIMKACENCNELVHIAVRHCPVCGAEFIFKHNLNLSASSANVMTTEEWHEVDDVEYEYWIGKRGKPTLLVIYNCGHRLFKEYIPFEHGGFATHRARHWWKRRSDFPEPVNSLDAYHHASSLKKPTRILVNEAGKYPQIKGQDGI